MKKILLLDTNVSSFPIYNFLVNEGYEVYVAGSKENDCLAKCSTNYIFLDYSRIEELNKIIEDYKFDYIVPGCNDMSYACVTKINKSRKFPGLDPTEICETINNKSMFRDFAISNGLNVPKVYSLKDAYCVNVPLIIKPVDAYSGRGISIVNEPNKMLLDLAVENAIKFSKDKKYVIEEYKTGQLYSHSAFIENKKIVKDFIVVENCTANPFTVDSSYVVHDDFPVNLLESIRKDIEIIAKILKLEDGLIHTQFIRSGDSFYIIEVTRRCPGDLYSLLIEKSTNFKYSQNYVRPFIGKKIIQSTSEEIKKYIFRHTISSDADLFSIGIEFKNELDIDLYISLSVTGDEMKKSPFSRFGLVFIKCNDQKDLENKYGLALRRELYYYKSI
jgi:carbamoylphosphate synthase large subunit